MWHPSASFVGYRAQHEKAAQRRIAEGRQRMELWAWRAFDVHEYVRLCGQACSGTYRPGDSPYLAGGHPRHSAGGSGRHYFASASRPPVELSGGFSGDPERPTRQHKSYSSSRFRKSSIHLFVALFLNAIARSVSEKNGSLLPLRMNEVVTSKTRSSLTEVEFP